MQIESLAHHQGRHANHLSNTGTHTNRSCVRAFVRRGVHCGSFYSVRSVLEQKIINLFHTTLEHRYKAIGWDSFKADYLYMNSLSCIPQIHVCFVVPFLLINTIICVIYPPFPQYSRCLRSFLAFRKLLNVNKIAVAITSASRGLVEILLLLLMHLFMFAMLGFVLFSTVASDRQDGCDFDGDRRGTARFCSSYVVYSNTCFVL